MTINIEQAEIHTATVQIKILTINDKQVTLAVFRQLQAEALLDADAELRGLPMGTVNYHPEKDCPTTEVEMEGMGVATGFEHLHVVWQLGNELRRATVYEPSAQASRYEYHSPAGDQWLEVALLTGWCPAAEPPIGRQWRAGDRLWIDCEDEQGVIQWALPADLSQAGATLLTFEMGPSARVYGAADLVAKARAELTAAVTTQGVSDPLLWPAYRSELWARAYEHADAVDTRQRAFCDRWAELQALQQLFIAV